MFQCNLINGVIDAITVAISLARIYNWSPRLRFISCMDVIRGSASFCIHIWAYVTPWRAVTGCCPTVHMPDTILGNVCLWKQSLKIFLNAGHFSWSERSSIFAFEHLPTATSDRKSSSRDKIRRENIRWRQSIVVLSRLSIPLHMRL